MLIFNTSSAQLVSYPPDTAGVLPPPLKPAWILGFKFSPLDQRLFGFAPRRGLFKRGISRLHRKAVHKENSKQITQL